MPWIKLNDMLVKYQQRKELHAAYVCSVAQQVFKDEAKVASFKNGVLMLEVSSSARAANIQIQQAQILKSINNTFGQTLIKQLRYRVV